MNSELLPILLAGTRRHPGEDALKIMKSLGAEMLRQEAGRISVEAGQVVSGVPFSGPNPLDESSAYLRAAVEKYDSVMAEWLQLVRLHRAEVPVGCLPELLTWALPQPWVLQGILGEVGEWLAAQNPAWWAFSPHHETPARLIEQLPEQTPAGRKHLFKRLCFLDQQAAGEYLISVWGHEAAELRESMISLLGSISPPSTEVLFGLIQSDRSSPVRRAGQLWLAQFSEHPWTQTLRKLALEMVDSSGALQRIDHMDSRWEYLSIESGPGPEARLRRMIALCPPAVFPDAQKIYERSNSPIVRDGLSAGAEHTGFTPIRRMVAEEYVLQPQETTKSIDWSTMPSEAAEEFLKWCWTHLPPARRFGTISGILTGPGGFSAEFSKWAIIELRKSLGWNGPETKFWSVNTTRLAARLHPSTFSTAEDMLNRSQLDPRDPLIKTFFPILTLRSRLRAPFEKLS